MTHNKLRRKHKRFPTLRTGVLEAEGRRMECIVRDISGGGARLKVMGRSLTSGATGSLAIDGLGVLEAQVAWSQGSELGIRFSNAPACKPSDALKTADISAVLGLVSKKKRRPGNG